MFPSKLSPALTRGIARYRRLCTATSTSRPIGGSPAAQSAEQRPVHGPLPRPEPSTNGSAEHVITARVRPNPHPSHSVNSTSLGLGDIPDPHTHDPLKWRKAAWKYLGALGLFGIFYKSLHWYVDSVAEEARRKREDMEIAKTAVFETAEDHATQQDADRRKAEELYQQVKNPAGPVSVSSSPANDSDGAENPSGPSAVADPESPDGSAAATQNVTEQARSADTGFQVFAPLREDPMYVSPEDELKLLEVELEARLKKLRALKTKTRESEAEKRSIKTELRDVRAELDQFAKGP